MGDKKNLGDILVKNMKELVEELQNGSPLREKFTIRKAAFKLEPKPYDAEAVRATRAKLGVSQAVFAMVLGVSVDTVQGWEQGRKVPKGMACRFMDQINRDRKIALDILKEAIIRAHEREGQTV
jgi:DNA-binding transcriptional regulator YiaG